MDKAMDEQNTETDEDIIEEARERFAASYDFDHEQRQLVREDCEFAFDPERQWEEHAKEVRKGRPCMTYNRCEPAVDQLVGDERQMKPAIHVRPTEEGDKDSTEVLEGLIRNIEAMSDAETVYDEQFIPAAAGGFGAWRIVNDYSAEDSFDQDLKIVGYWDAANELWFDPASKEWHKQDGQYQFAVTWMPQDEFERQWPDHSPSGGWDRLPDRKHWYSSSEVAVVEYWRKVWFERELIALREPILNDAGEVESTELRVRWKDEIDQILDGLLAEGAEVVDERTVDTYTIEWYRLCGHSVLEGPEELPGRYFPNIPLYGKRRIVAGQEQYKGIIRNAKDPQRSYNYVRSQFVEATALTPKSPWLLTSKMIKGFTAAWQAITTNNKPYLIYNVDEANPNLKPERQDFQGIPQSTIALMQADEKDIRAVTGIHEAGLGMPQGQEQSGVALQTRQREGDVGNFQFTDNMGKSIRMTGVILGDMIPHYYDTERTIRILGEDGKEKFVGINGAVTGGQETSFDLNAKYDYRVEVGPSYTTQRQEAEERLSTAVQNIPLLQNLALDLVFKNSDYPGAQELYERIRKYMVASRMIEPEEGEEVPQQGPSEAEMLELRQLAAEIASEEAEADETRAKTAKLVAEVEQIVEEIRTQKADGLANLALLTRSAMSTLDDPRTLSPSNLTRR